MLSGSPCRRGNSPTLAALLPFGMWDLDPVKSTIRTLIQHDLGLPWGNFGLNCVKTLLAEAILELFEHIPGGDQVALRKNWSNSHSERGATTAEQRAVGKGSTSPSAWIRIQRWSFSFIFFSFWTSCFLFFFFPSFEELVLLTSAGTDSY